MFAALQIAQLIVAIVLIGTVLLLVRNSGLGSTLGGGDSAFFHSRRGLERLLFNFAIGISFLFFVLSVVVARFQ